jgi:dephospho-CoA kinase
VFDDSKLLDQLNKLVHPAVKKDFKKWAARQRAPYVIQEAAILFENGSYTEYDRIILVTAPEETRIARIVHRPGSSKKDIKARMRNQWEDSRKEALAHFTIVNTDMEKTQVAVDTIHAKLLKTTD